MHADIVGKSAAGGQRSGGHVPPECCHAFRPIEAESCP
jgi:hypothetical protein